MSCTGVVAEDCCFAFIDGANGLECVQRLGAMESGDRDIASGGVGTIFDRRPDPLLWAQVGVQGNRQNLSGEHLAHPYACTRSRKAATSRLLAQRQGDDVSVQSSPFDRHRRQEVIAKRCAWFVEWAPDSLVAGRGAGESTKPLWRASCAPLCLHEGEESSDGQVARPEAGGRCPVQSSPFDRHRRQEVIAKRCAWFVERAPDSLRIRRDAGESTKPLWRASCAPLCLREGEESSDGQVARTEAGDDVSSLRQASSHCKAVDRHQGNRKTWRGHCKAVRMVCAPTLQSSWFVEWALILGAGRGCRGIDKTSLESILRTPMPRGRGKQRRASCLHRGRGRCLVHPVPSTGIVAKRSLQSGAHGLCNALLAQVGVQGNRQNLSGEHLAHPYACTRSRKAATSRLLAQRQDDVSFNPVPSTGIIAGRSLQSGAHGLCNALLILWSQVGVQGNRQNLFGEHLAHPYACTRSRKAATSRLLAQRQGTMSRPIQSLRQASSPRGHCKAVRMVCATRSCSSGRK